MSAIVPGIAPNSTAQGEKIEEIKKTAVAQAAMNRDKLAAGVGSRRSGVAATTVVTSISLSSTRRPVTTGSSPAASHKGVRLSTTGMWAKLYGGGGESVAHSRLAAPHGFAGAIAPR